MSCLSQAFSNDDGIVVEAFVFYCDGCGKVTRARKWKGRHRLGIDPPPKGWVETMGGSHGEGIRIAWCSKACEEPTYNMTPEERHAMFEASNGRLTSALRKCGRKIMGLQPWEKGPWDRKGKFDA